MRALAAAPLAFIDPVTGAPAFGSYAGPLPPVGLPRIGTVAQMLRGKKWLYIAVVSDAAWLSLAIVRTGYAATAFAFVYDRIARTMVFDRTALGPPSAAFVADDPHASGEVARFAFAHSRIVVERRSGSWDVRARLADLEVDATLDPSSSPPAITAIASLGPGLVSGTEKRLLLAARGRMRAFTRAFDLDRALAGYDYTHGQMPRRTRWRWAFGMGRSPSGRAIGLNLTDGFVGEAECAAFFDGRVVPLGEPRISFDAARVERAWSLAGDGTRLTFDVGATHAQRTNLLLVRSRFVQPVGAFRGSLDLAGERIELADFPGVVEDQDVTW